MTVGRTSGRQNTAACAAVSCGSTAKAQPPTPIETLGRTGLGVGVGGSLTHYCVVIFLIGSVTTQKFPGESGPIETCQILIPRDRPPVCGRWHCETPQSIRGAAVSSHQRTDFLNLIRKREVKASDDLRALRQRSGVRRVSLAIAGRMKLLRISQPQGKAANQSVNFYLESRDLERRDPIPLKLNRTSLRWRVHNGHAADRETAARYGVNGEYRHAAGAGSRVRSSIRRAPSGSPKLGARALALSRDRYATPGELPRSNRRLRPAHQGAAHR
jgi:hypothetical protein